VIVVVIVVVVVVALVQSASATHLGQHLDYAKEESFASSDLLVIVSPLNPADIEQSAALHGRAAGDTVEAGAIVGARAACGLGDVQRDRHRSAAELIDERSVPALGGSD
jgi:hypothetical protein